MSRGGWCIVFALVGWLALSAQAPQPKAGAEQAKAAANAQQSPAQLPVSRVEMVNQPSEPRGYQDPCKGNESDRNSDLCAQWTAAHNARDAAYYAWLQLWAAGAGMIGLLMTIVLTYRAVRTAQASVAVAQETAKIQLRAYCSMLEIEGGGAGLDSEPQFVITTVNTGQTPAKRLRIDTACWLAPAGPVKHSADLANHAEVTIGSGKTIGSRAALGYKLTPEQWANLATGTLVLYVGIYGEYVDIFGDPQSFASVGFVIGLPDHFGIKPVPGTDLST